MRFIILFIIFILSVPTYAQQAAQSSLFMFNTLMYNPASAGKDTSLDINFLHRKQWVGVNGAPVSSILSVDGPVNYKRIGLGFSLIRENIVATTHTNISTSYAYKVKMYRGILSMGLAVQYRYLQFDPFKLNIKDQDDLIMSRGIQNSGRFSLGTGIFYTHNNYYFGFSVTHLNQEKFKYEYLSLNQVRHFYFTGGYTYSLTDKFQVMPYFLLKYIQPSLMQADVALLLKYTNAGWLGLGYRTKDALYAQVGVFLAGANPRPKNYILRLVYSYEWPYGKSTALHTNSHEVGLLVNYEVPRSKRKILKKKKVVSPVFP